MSRCFYFPLFCLSHSVDYFWRSARRGNRKSTWYNGISLLWFPWWNRFWSLFRTTFNYSRLHWSRPSFRKYSLRFLQVNLHFIEFQYSSFALHKLSINFIYRRNDMDYLALRLWIGLWVATILIVLVAVDASAFVCYITRFTEENFALLIATIFIYKVINNVFQHLIVLLVISLY